MKTIILAAFSVMIMGIPAPNAQPWSHEKILDECIWIFESVGVEVNGYKTLEEALVGIEGGDTYSLDLYQRLKSNKEKDQSKYRIKLLMETKEYEYISINKLKLYEDMKEYFDTIQYLGAGYASKEEGISDMFSPTSLILYYELGRWISASNEAARLHEAKGGWKGKCIEYFIEFFKGVALKKKVYSSVEVGLADLYGDTAVELYKRLKEKPPGEMSEEQRTSVLIGMKEWFEKIEYKKAGYKSLYSFLDGTYNDFKVGATYHLIKKLKRPPKEGRPDAKKQ